MPERVSALRLGSYYRAVLAPYLGIAPTGPRALDVGAADGMFLQCLLPVQAVALDPSPLAQKGMPFVRGDGSSAPFRSGAFDTVFALDVLEHVIQDRRLMLELVRLLRPGGTLWLSVPSRGFTAFPPFLTGFLHQRWGHVRPGYRLQELLDLLPCNCEVTVLEWNEPLYRLGYFPLKALSLVAPGVTRRLLRLTAWLDNRRPSGHQGHYFCCLRIPVSEK